jgi:ferredoxin
MLALQNIGGDLIVLSWLYPRAARWVLDRNGIRGREGVTLLKGFGEGEDDDELDDELENEANDDKERVVDTRPLPPRKIYCFDLRAYDSAVVYVEEIRRIVRENATPLVQLGGLNALQIGRRDGGGNGQAEPARESKEATPPAPQVVRIEEKSGRRWYPVIDYSRCTNCMECIDFCLFGVYGVDKVETILVEQPDNCRKGCPACSRVCPENAIIFPQHKTPAIAGAPVEIAGLKIDLSALFGAPEKKESAAEAAIRERDEQLLLAGRTAVGATVGIAKRQENRPSEPRDELDDLLDKLDEF